VEGEQLVRAAQNTYEVGLKYLDCFRCNISPVVMGRDELVLHVVAFDSFFELG
jgi:hypothetical protein